MFLENTFKICFKSQITVRIEKFLIIISIESHYQEAENKNIIRRIYNSTLTIGRIVACDGYSGTNNRLTF